MRNKCYLPKSYEELSALSYEKLDFYWKIFYLTTPRNKKAMLRPLWYAIQCERFGLKLADKHITRLTRYSDNSERYKEKANKNKYSVAAGTEIIKNYKDREYKVFVIGAKEFVYKNKSYRTLFAVAKVFCGKKVSGPDFF